jgi:hypothetical protein
MRPLAILLALVGVSQARLPEPPGPGGSAPLAKRRPVRAETWVSKSRYHDGGDQKVTVTAPRAELFGRPQVGGAVVGLLRRGEVVSMVRRSGDGRWLLVDIGGGDVAWLDAKATRPGAIKTAGPELVDERVEVVAPRGKLAATPASIDREPGPEPRKAVAPPPEAPAPLPPPPPVAKPRPVSAKPPRPSPSPDGARKGEPLSLDDDAAWDRKRRKQKPIQVASRGDLAGLAAQNDVAVTVAKSAPASPSSANSFALGAEGGVAVLGQHFSSNGIGALTNYAGGTTAFAVGVNGSYARAVGSRYHVGVDAAYSFAGAAGVRYRTADGSNPVLGMQTHLVDGVVTAGARFGVLGGLDVSLHLGIGVVVNLVDMNPSALVPSDRIIGMTLAVSASAPELFTIAGRPVGLGVYAGALAPADRAQTVNLEDGTTSSTVGGKVGALARIKVWRGLAVEGGWSWGFVFTHYTGQAHRNPSISVADRASDQHLITLGLNYAL